MNFSSKIIIGATLVLAFACSETKKESQPKIEGPSFHVIGNLRTLENKKLLLLKPSPTGYDTLLKSKVASDGSIDLYTKLDSNQLVILDAEGVKTNLVEDAPEVEVNFDGKEFSYRGSRETALYNENLKMNLKFQEQFQVMQERFKQASQTGNSAEIAKINDEYKVLYDSSLTTVMKFVEDNSPSYTAYHTLIEILNSPNGESHSAFLKRIKSKYENAPYPFAADLVEKINQMLGFAEGEMAPDIKLPDPNGKIISLSSLKGKTVLIDFWASWCGPCVQEIPNVKATYAKYKSKGFEVYGVSLDAKAEAWTTAIQKFDMNWIHVSDLKYWDSEVVPLYNIKGIPLTILIDKEGKIIAKNLRGAALEQKVAEVLK